MVCETTQPDSLPPKASLSACHPGNSLDGSVSSQTSQERGTAHPRYKDLREKLGLMQFSGGGHKSFILNALLSVHAEGAGCLYQILNSTNLSSG